MIADLQPYPEYKESGLPWLGKVPGHWQSRRMKFLFREQSLKGFPREPLLAATQSKGVVRKEDYGSRTVTAMNGLENLKLVEIGDFVISLRSFQGGIEVSHARGIISPAYTVLRPRVGFEPRYFKAYFKSPAFISSLTLFVTGIREGQNIDYERLSRAFMPLPPPEEQAAIVRFLDWANGRLERAIRAKRKVIALLNEQKQAIIHRAVTRGLDPSVPLKPSGIPWLGDIPAHWEVRRLKSVLGYQLTNGVFKRGDAFGSGVPLVNVADIYAPEGRIRPERLERVRVTPGEVDTFRVLPGDIFFVRSSLKLEGTGRCAFVESLDEDTVFECHVVRARPQQERVVTRFLVMFLSSWVGVSNTVSRANTVTMSTLSQGAINSLPIVVPPISEQVGILKLVDTESSPVKAAISRLEREIDLLREYRTRLVADVVTGKFDVREAAARLPEESAVEPSDDDAELDDEAAAADEETVA